MKKLALATLLASSSVLCACSSTGTQPSTQAQLQQMVAEKWSAYGTLIGQPSVGGAAVYVSSPLGSFFASANMGNATEDIHFRVASNTKTFTAAAIMLLHQRGQINIDDFITAKAPGKSVPYIPATADYDIPYKGDITIRELLSHTAGVFDVTNDNIPPEAPCEYSGKSYLLTQDMSRQFTFDELVGVVAKCKASYWAPSEKKYHYSNTGYSLLGKIIETVSGVTYSQFVADNLFAPNGLAQTSSPSLATERTIPAPSTVAYSIGYLVSKGQVTSVTEDNLSPNVAEGNIISTPRELATWDHNLLTGAAGPNAQTVALMKCTIPDGATSCYGLGIEDRTGLGWGHTGAHNGYLSIMGYDPALDLTVVVFFSLLNFDDIAGEAAVLIDVAKRAHDIAGSTNP